MLRSNPLNSGGDNFSRSLFAIFVSFGLYLTDNPGHFIAGVFFALREQQVAGFFQTHLRNILQLLNLLSVEPFHIVGALVDCRLALIERHLTFFQAVGADIQFFAALLQAVVLPVELIPAPGYLRIGSLADFQSLVPSLQFQFAGLLPGLLQDLVGALSFSL